MLRRQRPVAVRILAAALAFRLFALLIPLAYVLVAGLGLVATSGEQGGPGRGDRLGDLIVVSIATVARGSDRGRWLAVLAGGVATLLAAGGVVEVLRWVHLLAWRLTPTGISAASGRSSGWSALWLALSWALPRPSIPWTALVPGSLLFAAGFLLFSLAVRLYFAPRAVRTLLERRAQRRQPAQPS